MCKLLLSTNAPRKGALNVWCLQWVVLWQFKNLILESKAMWHLAPHRTRC